MEKKIYEKPAIQLEEFIPNECVAACGSEKKFAFECDAPVHGWYEKNYPYNWTRWGGYWDKVYYWPSSEFNPLDPNTKDKKMEQYTGTTPTYLTKFHTCHETHDVNINSKFYFGFVDRDDDKKYDAGEGVVVWLGNDSDNCHCSASLTSTDIPLVKS